MFTNLDHLANIVRDTEQALQVYRDQLGLPLLFSEVLEEQGVRLTHLDLGNCPLQLIELLWADHSLRSAIGTQKSHLHYFCLKVESVPEALQELPKAGITLRDTTPRRGPNERKSIFLDPISTGEVLIEITSDQDS